jgi:hypothetical protein
MAGTDSSGNQNRSINHGVAAFLRGAHHLVDEGQLPGWLRPHQGEHRFPVMVAVAVAAALQLALPERLSIGPRWILPALELALLVALTVANPLRLVRHSRPVRVMSLVLVAAITLGNAVSAVAFIVDILNGNKSTAHASTLLRVGAEIYLTNVIAFGLWYWELDRGGPFLRSTGAATHPDLLFPQMSMPELAQLDWHPRFVDYLYVSFTNATAFSPTDTLPLSRWAKLLMALQSAVSLAVVGLVIARAVNILGT